MSSLKVLLYGNNPNIILLASRFQLANSVDLYHVSDSTSNHYEIETYSYGFENFTLSNHFNSIQNLIDNTNNNNNKLLCDLIILSATSLQELSTVSSQLSPLITNNTKIFIESSGSIQLEPFIRMSINTNHHINVLSIVSNFDIRQIDPLVNKFKQFGPKETQNIIYLGDSSVKSYGSTTQNLLTTFQRLFTKLFPQEIIDLSNYSSLDFLKIQWQLTLSQICFDPLLIMLEETNTKILPNLILAKPLISGLVTEVVSIINKMGVTLDDSMNGESHLLTHWQSLYPNDNDIPPLVYHFINKTASLNIDLIWLQIILLADDQNIKTPYLEFLYSVMSQFQKINNNESKWFKRNLNENSSTDDEINNNNNNQLQKQITSLQQDMNIKNDQLNQYKDTIDQLKSQVSSLKNNQTQIVDEYESQIVVLKQQINDLKLTQSTNTNNNNASYIETTSDKMVNKNLENVQNSSASYRSTGTPDLNDLEDLAVFGVSYGDSPLRTMNKYQKGEQTQPPTSSNGSATSQNINTNSSEGSTTSQGDVVDENKILQERELDLKRKELELQERELELQRRALQQQQQQQQYVGRKPKMTMNNNNQISQVQSNRSQSFNPLSQQPQKFNPSMRPNRNLYGATASTASATNFNDPISSGMGYAGGFPQQQQQQPLQQQQHHAIKPTSRKNRTSNMPNLRNPSNTNMTSFQNNMMNNIPPQMNSQSRLNSLSSQSMNFQTRIRNPQQQQNMHSASFNNLNANIRSNTMQHMPVNFNQQQLQQRQISSSSVDVNNVGNISTNSVVHNQLRPHASMSNVNNMQSSTIMPALSKPLQQTQQQQQLQPQKPQIASHGPIQLGTPPISQSASYTVEASPASFSSNTTTGTSQTTDSEKKKKKKFGFFKKKGKK